MCLFICPKDKWIHLLYWTVSINKLQLPWDFDSTRYSVIQSQPWGWKACFNLSSRLNFIVKCVTDLVHVHGDEMFAMGGCGRCGAVEILDLKISFSCRADCLWAHGQPFWRCRDWEVYEVTKEAGTGRQQWNLLFFKCFFILKIWLSGSGVKTRLC